MPGRRADRPCDPMNLLHLLKDIREQLAVPLALNECEDLRSRINVAISTFERRKLHGLTRDSPPKVEHEDSAPLPTRKH